MHYPSIYLRSLSLTERASVVNASSGSPSSLRRLLLHRNVLTRKSLLRSMLGRGHASTDNGAGAGGVTRLWPRSTNPYVGRGTQMRSKANQK